MYTCTTCTIKVKACVHRNMKTGYLPPVLIQVVMDKVSWRM